MLHVPIVRQSTGYSCGAAVALAVGLYWRAWDGHEPDLFPALETTEENGTEPDRIARLFRGWGLRAQYRTGMTVPGLRRCLARGATVVLALQAWPDAPVLDWRERWDDGHYVVLVGMTARRATFMCPSCPSSYAWLPIEELRHRWHDVDPRGRQQGPAIVVQGTEHLPRFPARSTRLG